VLSRTTRIFALQALLVTALGLAGCGSPRTTVDQNTALDQAIACYIDGNLERAELLLTRIISRDGSNTDHATAYLYLGRIYLARGDYEKAADAFSAGRALGGDIRFAEYFEEAQRHLTSTPERIVQLPRITRGQLAFLIEETFGKRLAARLSEAERAAVLTDTRASGGDGESPEPDPSEKSIESFSVVRAGVITALPDGDFHVEDAVTAPAFYTVMWRLTDALGGAGGVLPGLFPGGYRATVGALKPTDDVRGQTDAGDGFVTGFHARSMLEAFEKAVQTDSE
jgi:tetratricopeptide (TPR) repeat protein